MRFSRLIPGACVLIGLAGALFAQHAPQKPVNVVLIMSDQHNAHLLGFGSNGFGGVQTSLTPNLDRLAQEGVHFTRAFAASPQCMPSRYSALTGRWPHYHGLGWNGIWEPRVYETLVSLARNAGYETISTGKDHMRIAEQPVPLDDFGFNQFFRKDDYKDYCAAHGVPPAGANGNYWSMPDLPGKIYKAGYTFNTNEFHRTGYYTDRALDFLDERAVDGEPFVLYLQPPHPHAPLLPCGPAGVEDWAHLYQPFEQLDLPPNFYTIATTQLFAEHQAIYAGLTEDEWRQILSYYYGLTTQVDWNIGRVLDRLDEHGFTENTLVIYTADHGELGSEMRTWTKGRFHYDSINRIPLIMRLPGVLPEGRAIDSLVNNVDLFPTIAEVTGMPVTDERRAQLDGVSLLDLALASEEPAGWRQETFAELGTLHWGKTRMVRTKTAKYTYGSLYDEEELYDLTVDPWETNNVVNEPAYAGLLDDLRSRMDVWMNDGIGHTPDYPTTATNGPPKIAARDDPQPGATDVARDVDPSWIPNPAAETQEVFFGTDPDGLALVAELTQMEASFNPGTLAPATTYYWRVDGINQHGTGVGELWSFETEAGGSGGPVLAELVFPPHRVVGVGLLQSLTWTPAASATSQVLHFGPEGSMVELATLPGSQTSFNTVRLLAGHTYHWRVDQVDAQGTTEGTVWIFTTSSNGLPKRATLVSPRHLDPIVTQDRRVLEWTPGAGATFHGVYFGTSFPLPFRGRLTDAQSFDPGPLQSGTTYYWRIDEGNTFGTVTGSTWRFQSAGDELGATYCDPAVANSTGVGGRMHVTGSADVALDELVLVATQLPPQPNIGYFIMGTGTNVFTPTGSAGPLCVTPGLKRYLPPVSNTTEQSGGFARFIGTSGPVSELIDPGSTWNFQAWHRDSAAATANFTDAVSVSFQ